MGSILLLQFCVCGEKKMAARRTNVRRWWRGARRGEEEKEGERRVRSRVSRTRKLRVELRPHPRKARIQARVCSKSRLADTTLHQTRPHEAMRRWLTKSGFASPSVFTFYPLRFKIEGLLTCVQMGQNRHGGRIQQYSSIVDEDVIQTIRECPTNGVCLAGMTRSLGVGPGGD